MKLIDVLKLYDWAIEQDFPFKRAPTAVGYSNQDIYYCWLKGHGRGWVGTRQSIAVCSKVKTMISFDKAFHF